jgi:hypothetical protein
MIHPHGAGGDLFTLVRQVIEAIREPEQARQDASHPGGRGHTAIILGLHAQFAGGPLGKRGPISHFTVPTNSQGLTKS